MNNSDKKLLVECINFEVIQESLNESINDPSRPFIVEGIFQRKGSKNQNGRVYPDGVLEREVQKYMDTLVRERRALGELDHPQDSVVNLKNVSHNVIDLRWNGDDLIGKAEILTTPSGNILRELFKNRIKVGISSRALGTLKKISESTSMVGNDLELVCFDFVSNPSTQGAFPAPNGQIALSENVVINPITNRWEKTDEIIRNILSEIS